MKYDYPQAPAFREYSTLDGVGHTDKDRKAIARHIPCQEACPAATNVPLYIERVAQGDWAGAYAVNLACNVFPGVLGRICTRPCQARCRHQWTNTSGPVTICHLKRAAADRAAGAAAAPKPWFGPTGKRVAVVGGGPAGLAAARDLRRLGHSVTLFERESHLGGMLVDGIPRFRLPLSVVEREIGFVVDTGVDVRLGEEVGAARLRELSAAFDAVLVAAGNAVEGRVSIPGVPEEAMLSGLAFMRRYNAGEVGQLEGDVIVLGGGFTAVDCARASARAARKLLGAEGSVSVMYRRTEQYMAAHPEELEEMERERIGVRTLVTAVSGTARDGRLESVTFRRNVLASGGASGKPAIEPVPGSEFTVPCSTLIIAVGQSRDAALLPPEGLPNLFEAGDFAGGANVIEAVASGKRAARAIDERLMGARRLEDAVAVETVERDGETGRVRDHDLVAPAAMPVIPVAARAAGDAEVEAGLDDAQAAANARRCYLCHYTFEIDPDACIQCGWCIDAAPRRCIKRLSRVSFDADGAVAETVEAAASDDTTYIWIDPDACIRCGKCLRVCPTGAISMKRSERVTRPCGGSTCEASPI
jgi:formate dehydrogenase major subunit